MRERDWFQNSKDSGLELGFGVRVRVRVRALVLPLGPKTQKPNCLLPIHYWNWGVRPKAKWVTGIFLFFFSKIQW